MRQQQRYRSSDRKGLVVLQKLKQDKMELPGRSRLALVSHGKEVDAITAMVTDLATGFGRVPRCDQLLWAGVGQGRNGDSS